MLNPFALIALSAVGMLCIATIPIARFEERRKTLADPLRGQPALVNGANLRCRRRSGFDRAEG
jgi:hypothetical protein